MSEDLILRQRVIDELQFDPGLDAAHIGVSARNGVVTLTGTVNDVMERRHAELAAHRVKGVKAVALEIHVKLPTEKKLSDDEIAGRAAQILKWAVQLPEGALHLTVAGGCVTLTGEVEWHFQRKQAEECLYRLGGVIGVLNLVRIKPHVAPGDISTLIKAALERSADLDASAISVKVVAGNKVVLTGRVHSLHQQILAENAAISAPGVTDVENHLAVV